MNRIIAYFASFPRPQGWKKVPCVPKIVDNPDKVFWPTVPEKHRPRVDAWFWMKVAEVKRRNGGKISPAKYSSLRGNAINFGVYVLTGKRRANRSDYERKKRIYLAYQEWLNTEDEKPKTKYKVLGVF